MIMLGFFFNRNSFLPRIMELMGLLGLGLIFWRAAYGQLTFIQIIFAAIITAAYLFLRFCTLWRWYPQDKRSLGIGLHFQRIMMGGSYALAVATWLFILTASALTLAAFVILFAAMCTVNIIVIVFHLKDHDLTPANIYSMTH